MRFPAAAVSVHAVLPVAALLALDVLAHSHTSLHAPRHSQWKRDMQSIVDFSTSNPVAAAQEVQRLPYVPNNTSGDIDSALLIVQNAQQDSQLPWNSAVPFIATPDATLSPTGGWQGLPSLEGFTLNRSWEIVPGAIMPFYMTAGLEAVNVRRAVICWPGKPRDSWRYANLYRNALSVVEANTTSGVEKGTVMIVAPAWLNDIDQQSGAVLENELFFHGSTWEAGGASRGPALNHTLSTYSIMDNFTDMLFDKAVYPNLNQVVIAGHSMGGQAAHRYAVLKKQKRYDDNMSYWVGNPGSWTWLTPERPYHNSSCSATFDSWHYGLGQNQSKVTKYAQRDVVADKNAVVQRYLSRKVHMALGLLDVGPGDTHCEARDQGASHLDRGSQYVLHLANVNQGTFPPSQSVDFIANTSHQDFPMISTNASLHWLFLHDYDISHPDIAPSNPGDRPHKDPTVVVHRPHAYATDGNKLLATSLMAGSIGSVAFVLLLLPFLFPANWSEEEDDPKQEYDDCLRRSSTLVEHTMPSRFRFPSTASSISDGGSTLKPFD